MSDIAYEFRAHGELWGITEPQKRRDLFTMEWGWEAYYAPISFASHSKTLVTGRHRGEVITNAIEFIVSKEVVQAHYCVVFGVFEEEFVEGDDALRFAEDRIERDPSESVSIYELQWGGRRLIRTLGGDE